MAALRDPLFWFLGDEPSAVGLSMHWDHNFFIELVAAPTLDTSPEKAARIFRDRVAQVTDRLASYVKQLEPAQYGVGIVSRFPAMVRQVDAYTRSSFGPEHAVLRCYLPAVAGHNLLMGAELTLAESPRGSGAIARANRPSAADAEAASLRKRLRRVTSLRFSKDTMEAALEQLSEAIGARIVILGADLQADGITKNQSFAIDIQQRPAEEILIEILRLANPDKTAKNPADERQKLVYVILPGGTNAAEQIVVTTRSAAARRGDALPAVFTANGP
jgi:hypothetical protein